MAAYGYQLRKYPNQVLQSPKTEVLHTHDFRAEAAGKLGQLVVFGTDADQATAAGADSVTRIGVAIGRWKTADGNYAYGPAGEAYAAGDLIRVVLLQNGLHFIGLLPTGDNVARGEFLKAGAVGRLTKLAGTAAVVDALSRVGQALEAVNSAADDTTILWRCAE